MLFWSDSILIILIIILPFYSKKNLSKKITYLKYFRYLKPVKSKNLNGKIQSYCLISVIESRKKMLVMLHINI